ncbi:hypothetical protein [Nocardia sp. NPDC057353]|uniref:hypothetical protein n=1 Tax=Nocardia sp. NPDC057353 TaxID=3346104 RepID=UPI00362B4A2D
MLTTAARAELEHTAASVTSRMFVALMQRDAGVPELAAVLTTDSDLDVGPVIQPDAP